jgi:hypothetical protein
LDGRPAPRFLVRHEWAQGSHQRRRDRQVTT